MLVDGGYGIEVSREALLCEAESADGRETTRDARRVDLAPLAAPQPVDQRRGARVRADDAGVDRAELERRVGDGPVEAER